MTNYDCELLAPAGNLEICYGVLNAGADAVYVGGNLFGARAYANNFSQEELIQALHYAHLKGKKVFLTVNTLLKEVELEDNLYHYLKPYYEEGLDAVIVQDMGVLSLIKDFFPKLPIHASTQMSIAGAEGAKFLSDLGVARVVTARELSLKEIRHIKDSVPNLEIESFIHGALCYSYSGQCLMSSMIGGRSGNRGRCAQPCRLPYEVLEADRRLRKQKSNILSLKDLCTIDLLPQILESGVYSLKIEGRMKQIGYAAGVVSVYRKYLELLKENGPDRYQVTTKDYQMLLDCGNRSGFTNGYYYTRNESSMVTFDSASHVANDSCSADYVAEPVPEMIEGELTLRIGEPAVLSVSHGDEKVEVLGDVVMGAQTRPLDSRDVKKRMCKTGNTPFQFSHLQMEYEEDIFLPIGRLNELRRNALEQLEEKLLAPYKRVADVAFSPRQSTGTHVFGEPGITVSLERRELLDTVLEYAFIRDVYLDIAMYSKEQMEKEIAEDIKKLCGHNKRAFVMLPAVFRRDASEQMDAVWKTLKTMEVQGFVARSYDGFEYLRSKRKEKDFLLVTDSSLYAFNGRSGELFRSKGADRITLPVELNKFELLHQMEEDRELLIYGYLPLMTTAGCVEKNTSSCRKKTEFLYLRDRMNADFPVRNWCSFCYNTIYNSQPFSLLHASKDVSGLHAARYRLHFSLETAGQVKEILKYFYDSFFHNSNPVLPDCLKNYTNGHFKRGVE